MSPCFQDDFETALRHQIAHALVIRIIVVLPRPPTALSIKAAWIFVFGTAIFSGSLYCYAPTGTRLIPMATPFGGLVLMAAGSFLCCPSLGRMPEARRRSRFHGISGLVTPGSLCLSQTPHCQPAVPGFGLVCNHLKSKVDVSATCHALQTECEVISITGFSSAQT